MSAALLEQIIETQEGSPAEDRPEERGQKPSSPEPPHAPIPEPPQDADDVSVAAARQAAADAEKLLENEQVRQWIAGKTPSKRNREVFRAVVGFGRAQSEVAAAFGISQPRVNQILKQVGSWLGRVVAQRDQALSPAEQLQQSENVSRMQYDAVYSTAMQLLADSQQSTTVEKCRRDQAGNIVWSETTTRKNRANASLLGHALRAISERAKFEGTYGSRGEVGECGSTGVRENSPPPPHSHTPAPPHSATPAPPHPYKPLSRGPADKPSAETAAHDVNVRTQTTCADSRPAEKLETDQPASSYRPEARASRSAISDAEYAQLMARADEEYETKFRDEGEEVKVQGPLSQSEAAAAVASVGDELHEYVALMAKRNLKHEPPDVQASAGPPVSAFAARVLLRSWGYGTVAADQLMCLFDPLSRKLLPPGGSDLAASGPQETTQPRPLDGGVVAGVGSGRDGYHKNSAPSMRP